MYLGQKTLTQIDVIIDSREDTLNPFFREYLTRAGLKVTVMKLEEGDFYLPSNYEKIKGVIVERKSWSDLANSIIDKRIWAQAKRLSEIAEIEYIKPYIVIEGNQSEIIDEREIPFNALLSVLDILQNSYNITILTMPEKSYVADWLKYMSKRLKREKQAESNATEIVIVQKPTKKLTIEDKIKFIARAIAGPTLGDRLLRKFGTIKGIVNASISDLMSVEGIGENRARELYVLFNKKIK